VSVTIIFLLLFVTFRRVRQAALVILNVPFRSIVCAAMGCGPRR
jgi:Cu/Ag efflux pump CusA